MPKKPIPNQLNEHGLPVCAARRHKDGGLCMLSAGWGTKHKGHGRCKLHGGASSGTPKGEKRNLIHGANSGLPISPADTPPGTYPAWLKEEDRPMWDTLVFDEYAVICKQILTSQYRMSLMLGYINDLRDELAISPDGLTNAEISNEQGYDSKGPTEKRTTKRVPIIPAITAIQEHLTKEQTSLAKLLDLKRVMDEKRQDSSNGRTDLLGQLIVTIETAARQAQATPAALRNVTDDSDEE